MEGTTILHYEIEELLGRGGMGSVYRALDTNLDTFRALKFLHPGLANLDYAKSHLLREARTQAKLFHPNIAALLELQKTDEHTFLVMEYVDGPALDVYLNEYRPTVRERFQLILQIACALDVAHSQGILHRDIKPRNVLVSSDGIAKVTDFGLAKALGQTTLTMSGETKGTAPYMAPEAFRGGTIEEPADVWSFGVLTHEVLEGSPPFKGVTFEAVAYQILNEPHPALSNHVEGEIPGISRFVDSCLNKHNKQRLANGSEVYQALAGIAYEAGVTSSIPALSIAGSHKRRRLKLVKRGAIAALLGMIIYVGIVLSGLFGETEYVEMRPGWSTFSGRLSVTWDNNGEYIAYFEKETSRLYRFNTTRTDAELEPIPLDTQVQVKNVSWAPDGTSLALSGSRGIWLYDLATSASHQISTQSVENLSWSEDGRWLVFSSPGEKDALERIGPILSKQNTLHIYTPERLQITGLNDLGGPLYFGDPIYILDDTRIAFKISRIGEDLGIYTIPSEGGAADPLMIDERCNYSLAWDSDQNELIYYNSWVKPDIYRIKVSKPGRLTGRPHALGITENISGFVFHPGTGRIVLQTTITRENIWRIPFSTDSDSISRIVDEFDMTSCPILLNDFRELSYVASSCIDAVHIRIRRLSDNTDRDLMENNETLKHESFPAASPDSRYIVFQAHSIEDSTRNLWLYDRVNPDFTQLTFDSVNEFDPAWASNGRSIYYVWGPMEMGRQWEIRQLFLNFVDGGVEPGTNRTVIKGDWNQLRCPLPSEDNRYLLYENNMKLYVLGPGNRTRELISGACPALNPTRRDVYYIRDNQLFRIRDWANLSTEFPEEELVSLLPQNTKAFYNGPPMAIGHDAAYVVLYEENTGEIKFMSPER